MNEKYILDGKTPVQVDLLEWAKWFDTADRSVGRTEIGDVSVSTVFLGIDHRNNPDGHPVLFETMIFGGTHDQYQARCSTWDEAEKQHARAVALVHDEQEPK